MNTYFDLLTGVHCFLLPCCLERAGAPLPPVHLGVHQLCLDEGTLSPWLIGVVVVLKFSSSRATVLLVLPGLIPCPLGTLQGARDDHDEAGVVGGDDDAFQC